MESLKLSQTPASCTWSRVGFRLSRVAESEQPESLIVCVREAESRRSVELIDCAECPNWVRDQARTTPVHKFPVPVWRLGRE
jgi:hypothetical protein